MYRTKVTGTCLRGDRGSEGASSWMGRWEQNLRRGSSMGQTVERESLGWPARMRPADILFMFLLDFKPQFLNYPLDTHEYARVSLRAAEITHELCRLQNEISALQQSAEYGPLDEDSRDKYAQYIRRLQDKSAVLMEEQREVEQVVSLHLAIDGPSKAGKKDRPEVKNRLLEQYKAAMIAKRSKKAAERMREVELERQIMEESEGIQQVGSQSAALVRPQRVALNPERHLIFGRFQEPTPGLLRFRDSQSQQKAGKVMNQLQRNSMNKSVKLPPVPKSLPAAQYPGFLLHSAPMKLSQYQIADSRVAPRSSQNRVL